MSGTAIDTDGARLLVDKVRGDASLPAATRRRVRALLSDVAQPALVLDRLSREATRYLPSIPRKPPAVDLVRVVTAGTFWRYHTRPEVHDAFLTADDFALVAERRPDPGAFLLSCLSDNDPLMPWRRSWLAELTAVRGLPGAVLNRVLELDKAPPFVLFVFSATSCATHGITVRKPCSLDSVFGPNLQWNPGGPRSGAAEFVDGDLPRAAVTSLLWVA